MNPSRPLRRALAMTASATLGLIGAVAIASPASAHHSEVSGVPYCDTATGEWVVTWTVNSFAPRNVDAYRLAEVLVTPEGSDVSGIAVTESGFPHSTDAPLVGEQRLPGDATSASLGVRAEWDNDFTERKLVTAQVSFEGTCETPQEPGPLQITDADTCVDLTVTVTNPEDGATVKVILTTSAGDEIESDLEPGEGLSETFPAAEDLTYEVTVDGAVVGSGGWEDPGDCEFEVPVASQADCDSLTIEVTNPLEQESIEATVSSGDVEEVLTIAPGESAEVTFDAEEGTVATVTIGGESLEIPWELPVDCEGEGGGLPVTGSSTPIVIGAALALLAAGAGLFLVARRRRISFTA